MTARRNFPWLGLRVMVLLTYAFMLGPMIHNRVGHLGFMVHVFFWGKSAEPLDLRLAPPAPQPAAQALNG